MRNQQASLPSWQQRGSERNSGEVLGKLRALLTFVEAWRVLCNFIMKMGLTTIFAKAKSAIV